jgi:Cytochrome c3
MTFIIRQISRTADGREIVRPVAHQGDSISIGRDAASTVHLEDLAVELNHAVLRKGEGGRLIIESVSKMPFALDGRSTSQAEIDPRAGCEIRMGGHRISISGDLSETIVSVERVAALSESSEEKEEIGLFTLKGLLPGRRPLAWALILLVLGLFLAWPIYTYSASQGVKARGASFHADKSWSSGPLSQAHKSLENDCQACHTAKFVSVTDETCLTCHKKDAHDHADPARIALAKAAPDFSGRMKGFFRAKFNHPEGRCVDCHTEHEGGGKMPATAQAFCTDCHASLKSRLTDTKIANAGDFGTSHPQFSPLITVGIDGNTRLARRISFTQNPQEDNGLKFPHQIHLSKTNGIARMTQTLAQDQNWGSSLACKDCHTPTSDGTRFQPIEMERQCGMCHSLAFDKVDGVFRTLRHGEPAQVIADLRAFYRSTSPTRPLALGENARRRPGDYAAFDTRRTFVLGARAWPSQAGEAINAVFSRGGACYDCHVVLPGYAIKKIFQPTRYLQKGWFDHEPHKLEACETCHKAGTSRAATDLLIPDLNSCRTCHVGGNGAHLASVEKPVESSCAMCHDYHVDGDAPWLTKQNLKRGTARASPQTTAAVDR